MSILSLDAFTIILDRPHNVTNIGAVVRAMRNMGFADLRLVKPVSFTDDDLLRMAHRCDELVASIQVFEQIDDALADATYVVGTAAHPHRGNLHTHDVRQLAERLVQRAANQTGHPEYPDNPNQKIALLFGQEADGLDRYALDRCHLIATLPTDPAYPALNLAQSVLLMLHEVRMAAMQIDPQIACSTVMGEHAPEHAPSQLAPHHLLERLMGFCETALGDIGFLRENPAPTLRALRQILYRAELRPDEVALLMAMARRVSRKVETSGRSKK
ncbi:MAG: TrmH family RNA methyltransferase [Chloroflexota bacterium]